MIAAIQCPQCPSDTAEPELLNNSAKETVGVLYTCSVCSTGWIEWRSE